MIVSDAPRLPRIVAEVWKPALALFVWDVIVTIVYFVLPFKAPSLPLTLFGSALALFLGFRDNSAYQRWWEGRGLWGLMINASRIISATARPMAGRIDSGSIPRASDSRGTRRAMFLA